jgi:hypothetical protein
MRDSDFVNDWLMLAITDGKTGIILGLPWKITNDYS